MLYLCIEAVGCPTICRHCWAQGVGYGAMPLADIEWVLEGAHRFCDGRGLAFDSYPMHEVAAHPDAARLSSLPQLDELTATLRRLPIDAAMCFETAGFLPTPRSRRNERLRPTLPGLLPVASRIAELTAPANRPWWASLEAHTEAAYVRQALAGDWPAARGRTPGELALVCRPNLDVHAGLAGHYRTRYGNLRADGIAAVLDRAVADGRRPDDALWFRLEPLPEPAELAAHHGDPTGLGVHPGPESVRYLWLDRAQRQAR